MTLVNLSIKNTENPLSKLQTPISSVQPLNTSLGKRNQEKERSKKTPGCESNPEVRLHFVAFCTVITPKRCLKRPFRQWDWESAAVLALNLCCVLLKMSKYGSRTFMRQGCPVEQSADASKSPRSTWVTWEKMMEQPHLCCIIAVVYVKVSVSIYRT